MSLLLNHTNQSSSIIITLSAITLDFSCFDDSPNTVAVTCQHTLGWSPRRELGTLYVEGSVLLYRLLSSIVQFCAWILLSLCTTVIHANITSCYSDFWFQFVFFELEPLWFGLDFVHFMYFILFVYFCWLLPVQLSLKYEKILSPAACIRKRLTTFRETGSDTS